jgi:hypothetical protein
MLRVVVEEEKGWRGWRDDGGGGEFKSWRWNLEPFGDGTTIYSIYFVSKKISKFHSYR